MKNKSKYFIFIFVFFVGILSLSPISGDDWGNYLVGSKGIIKSISNAVGMYFFWEGRFISRILINILTYNKFLWNIVNSLIITLIIYSILKYIKPRNFKSIFLISVLLILFMNVYTFSQVISWLAGNITYLFVVPFILLYFHYIINHDKYNKNIIFILLISSFIMTMFVEHMSLVLIFGDLLILIYKYIKNKIVDKKIIIYMFISILGFLIMFLSPGNALRNGIENVEFNNLSIFSKIIYNMPNFIYYTFIVNSFMLLLFSINHYLLIKNYINNKFIKVILLILMLFIPIITIIYYPLSKFINLKYSFLIDHNNLFIIIYWIIYLIISMLLFLKYSIKKKNYYIMFFFIIGLSSNLFMLMSPTWGFRTCFFTYLCLSISNLYILDNYIVDNYITKLLYPIVSVGLIFYLVLYINVYNCQKDLEKSIKKQLNSNSSEIIVPLFPDFVNCNINPMNDFHVTHFKKYYNIPNDKNIKFVDNWKYVIFYKK